MKIGDEVYYKFEDGEYLKVKLTDIKMRYCFDAETDFNGSKLQLKDIPSTKLIEATIYNSELFNSLSEMEQQ